MSEQSIQPRDIYRAAPEQVAYEAAFGSYLPYKLRDLAIGR
ncbi:hypothetical protein [Streptomyces sp. NPDC090083]